MVTMGVAPSDRGEEEGSEVKNGAAIPPLFFFPVFFSLRSPLPPPLPTIWTPEIG